MHKIRQKDNEIYNALIPKKFTIIRDDVPDLSQAYPEMVLANDKDLFEEPLSLNAEIGISQFAPSVHLLKPAPKPQDEDDDLLYSAHERACDVLKISKPTRRIRIGRSPGRSPGTG